MHTAPIAFLLLTFLVGIHCTHYRGGSLYWSVKAGTTDADFAVTTYWAPDQVQTSMTFAFEQKATATTPAQITYKTYTFPYTTIGDNEYAAVTGSFTYKFPAQGTYNVWYGECCRLATLKAGANLPFKLFATVIVDGTYRSSPIVSVPPVLALGVGLNSIPLMTSEPVTAVTFTPLSESGLACNPATMNCTNKYNTKTGQPLSAKSSTTNPSVVITDAGFKLVWDTTAADVGAWALSVKVSTANGFSEADFIARIATNVVTDNTPTVVLTPNQDKYSVTTGQTVNFKVTCNSPKAAKMALVVPVGYPGLKVGGSTANRIPVTAGTAVDVSYTPELKYGGGNQAYVLTFICLNLDSYVQSTYPTQVVVYVGLPLVVTPPPTVNIDCHPHCGCLDPDTFGKPTVTDGCCGLPTITYTDEGADGSCTPYDHKAVVITRTWFVSNKCGQKDTKTQQIVIRDDKKPTIEHESCPDYEVQCQYEADDLANYGPTATDTCTDVTISYKDDAGYDKCNNAIKRTWTATDECGNVDTYTQTITVKDVTPPYITENSENSPHVECPYQKKYFDDWVIAIDNCHESKLTYKDSTDVECGKFTRTWTGTDECGNSADFSVDFDVSHTNKPTIHPNATYAYPQCIADIELLPIPYAKSYCGKDLPVKTRQPPTEHDTYGCRDKVTRYWITVDECGNQATYDEEITIKDLTKPVWTCFEDEITVECDYNKKLSDYPPNVVGGYPQASDNCKLNVTIGYVDNYLPSPCKSTIERTWTATDNCGNAVSRVQKIYVRDTTPPEGDAPCDVEIQCLSQLDTIEDAVLGKDCNKAYVSHNDTIINKAYEPCYDRKIRRTFKFYDECGNYRFEDMIITVKDTTPPTFGDLCNITAECRPLGSPDHVGYAKGTDNCGNEVYVDYDDVVSYGQYMDYIDRMWVIKDTCGNEDKILQRIKLNNTKPFLNCPSDLTVPCESGTAPNHTGYASASDQCTGTIIPTYTDNVIGACPKEIHRTWSASNDITKQSDQCTQIIKVGKDFGPHLKLPPDVTVQCKFQTPDKTTGKACSSKVCDEDVITTPTSSDSEVGTPCKAGYHINRKWTSSDNCNHSTSGTQVINIWDKTKPVIYSTPADYTTTCRFNISIEHCGYAKASDNCDKDGYPLDIKYVDSVVPSDKVCPSVITRVWTATDCSGNSASTEQRIKINEVGPYFPESYYGLELPYVDCEDCLTVPDIIAYDTCGRKIKPTYVVSKSGTCPTIITVVWTAIDDCGRIATLTKKTTVDDKIPPVIDYTNLATIVVECEADIPIDGAISVSDNCPNSQKPSFVDLVVPTDCTCKSCAKTVHRQWRATDNCGNAAYHNQTIIAEKKKPPKIKCPPNVTIECGNAYSADLTGTGSATAEDSCGSPLQVSYTDETTTFKNGNIEILRSWSATDNCGHTTTVVQKITIVGTIGDYSYGYVFTIPPHRDLPCGGNIYEDEYKYTSGNSYDDYTNQNLYLTSYCGKMTITFEPIQGCPAKAGQYVRTWNALRNGVIVASKDQYISVADCPPRGTGITNVPATPCSMQKQSTITPYLSVVDLDLPCETVTIVWTWGDKTSDTVVCSPLKPSNYCDFSGNQLNTHFSHSYSTSVPGIYPISALVYGARHARLDSYSAAIGSDYIIFTSQFTTINPYSGTVSGSLKLQYDSEYSITTAGKDYSCAKAWITDLPGYGATSKCSGYPRLEMSASFSYDNGYTLKATGHTYFTWENCGGADITFSSDNLLHLSIFADGRSALWTGTGYFGSSKTAYNFTVFVIDGGKYGSDKVHIRIFDAYKTYLDTDPCMPTSLFENWKVQPTRIPLTFLASGLDSDVTVRNPSDQTVSALTSENGSGATPVGLIVGIVAGIMVFIVVVATIVYFLLKKQQAATPPQQQRM